MNDTTFNQIPPAPETGAFDGSPLVLVRLALPDVPLVEHSFPRHNTVGTCLLAEAIRAALNLPLGFVVPCGELNSGNITIACGALPPASVISAALTALEHTHLAVCAVISIYDPRECFFREAHRGVCAAKIGLITPAILQADMNQALRDYTALSEEINAWLNVLKSFTPPPASENPS